MVMGDFNPHVGFLSSIGTDLFSILVWTTTTERHPPFYFWVFLRKQRVSALWSSNCVQKSSIAFLFLRQLCTVLLVTLRLSATLTADSPLSNLCSVSPKRNYTTFFLYLCINTDTVLMLVLYMKAVLIVIL